MKSKRNIAIGISFAAMFVIAMSSGIRGLLVPSFMKYFNVSSTEIGSLIAITTGMSVVAALVTAPMCQKLGYKNSVIIGLIINIVAYFLTSKTDNFFIFGLGYCAITFGVTFAVTSLNTVITVFKVSFQAVLVNMIHFFFGLGVTVAQKFGGDLLSIGWTWQSLFQGMAILFTISLIIVLFAEYPYVNHAGKKIGYHGMPHMNFLLLMCLSLGLYVAAEYQMGNWLINYLNKVYGYNEAHAGIYAAIFFGTFAIGRFVGGFIAERLGYVRAVGSFLLLATLTFVSGLLLGENGLWLVAGSGIFFSLIFPTVTLYMSNVYPEHKAEAISLLSTICNFIALVSTFLIGWLNDAIGTALAFWLIPICLGLSAVLFIILQLPNGLAFKVTKESQ